MNTKIRPFTPSTIHAQLEPAMLLLGLVLSACGAGARTTSGDLLEAVKQRRVLRIATDANYKHRVGLGPPHARQLTRLHVGHRADAHRRVRRAIPDCGL